MREAPTAQQSASRMVTAAYCCCGWLVPDSTASPSRSLGSHPTHAVRIERGGCLREGVIAGCCCCSSARLRVATDSQLAARCSCCIAAAAADHALHRTAPPLRVALSFPFCREKSLQRRLSCAPAQSLSSSSRRPTADSSRRMADGEGAGDVCWATAMFDSGRVARGCRAVTGGQRRRSRLSASSWPLDRAGGRWRTAHRGMTAHARHRM